MQDGTRQRRLVGAGFVALASAGVLAIAGALGFAALAAAAGALCCFAAVASTSGGVSANALASRTPAQHAAVGADLLLTTAWEATAYLRRVPDLARAGADVDAALARWRERGWLDRPERAFALPPPLEKPRVERGRVRGGGDVEIVSFASEFEPADSEIAAAYQAEAPNRTARALLWRHRDGMPRPVLLSIHGFGMGRFATDLPWLRVRGLDLVALHRELGLDVAYVLLPFHGPRTDGPSGAGFFDRHPLFATAALAQSIWDLRRLTGWLRAQGAPAVGVHGVSLGGLVTALYASLDASLATAIPMTPAVDLAAILWRQLPEARRREWRAAGLGPERLAEAWSLGAPLRHRPKVAPSARWIVGAMADQIATPDGVRALGAQWDVPAIHWLPGAHIAWCGRDAFRGALHAHLRDTLLAERPPAAAVLSRFRS